MIVINVPLPLSHSKNLLFVMCLQSHYSKQLLWRTHIQYEVWKCWDMLTDVPPPSDHRTMFLSNIITVIICSTLMPWNAANAANALRFITAWKVSHCDWFLTCWHIFICMPNTNHHVNPKAVGFWTNLSLSATTFTIVHQLLFLQCFFLLSCTVCDLLHCCMVRKNDNFICCSHWEDY